MRACFQDKINRGAIGALLATAWLLTAAAGARAQLPLFDGIDWVMDRGANSFNSVLGNPALPAIKPAGRPLRQGTNAFNLTVIDPVLGRPSATDPGNNNPDHGVRRNVWPRTADLTITGLLQNEIIDNPNPNDPNNDSDLNGNQVRVLPRAPGPTNNVSIEMPHAFLFGGWTLPAAVAPGAANDYRAPAGGFSFSSDPAQVYTNDYAFINAAHNDFLVDRAGGNQSPATQGELAGLPYVGSEVYAGVERVLKTTATATAVWELGKFNNTPARFTIDLYSPGDGTIVGLNSFPNVTRAIVRVSYGHFPTAADLNNVQTVDAAGQPIKAGVEDSRYSRLFLVDLGQSGWINLAPGGQSPSAFNYNGDPRYQIVVTLYSLTPDDVKDRTLFGNIPPKITADAVRFNPQPTVVNTPGLTQTANGLPVGLLNPAIYSIAPTGRILGPVVGTNKFTQAAFGVPAGDVTANDTQPLIYVAREESVPSAALTIPFDPTLPASTTNPLVADATLNVTAPVFYCIDNKNSNAQKGPGGALGQTVSVDRIRWRFVGLPDTNSGSGTASASPLLANVRCRDGVVRSIIYFVTTNATGTVGHIYALDPLGSRQDTITGLNYNTTTPYWIYPSYRPLSSAEVLAGKYPDQYHDPNYNASAPYITANPALNALETRNASGNLTTAPPFGADEANAPQKSYVDGDIIQNPAQAGDFIVRDDTRVPFTGMQSSPIVIDDPDNQLGAQILVVGGMNGRLYCLDAGGRGDWIYSRSKQNDAIDPATGVPYTMPGTTQRYWTWPHLRGDSFHARNGSGAAAPGISIANKIVDEKSKGSFPSSPAFEANLGVAQDPIYIGAGDGHMFALFAKHDKFNGVDNQNKPLYDERRSWVYPNSPTSKLDTQTLGAAPSTPAIFTPAGSGGNPYLYFTCAGRVYCIRAHPPLNGTPTFIPNTAPTLGAGSGWVYPPTINPPFPDPNNSLSDRLSPGFNGSAPVLISAADLNGSGQPGPPLVADDFCYVVQGDGTVYGIQAFTGAVNGVGLSFSGGATRCSPIAVRLTGITGFADDTANSQPAIVFADDDGAIWGVSARPSTTVFDPSLSLSVKLLPTIWGHFDSNSSRLAAASLVNGMIYEGSEDGQLRAYGVGEGTFGLGSTLDTGERAENGIGISAAGISIDLRGLNLFTAADYNLMTKSPPTRTPARNASGGSYGGVTADPIAGSINPGNGSPNSEWPAAVDWGDGLYIAGYGVYHAQPQNNNDGTHAPKTAGGVPKVQVQLTITQPGQQSLQITVDAVPNYNSGVAGVTAGNLWPDDRVLRGAGIDVSIYGVDDPSQERNTMSNTSGEKLTGRAAGVFPYSFFYKLPILPDGAKPFTPGSAGYRVSARAVLTQDIAINTAAAPQTYIENSNFLQIGQHDYVGLVPRNGDNTIASAANPVVPVNPNQINTLGRRRDVLITNPIAVTVRSFTPAGGGAADMTGGNLPNIIGMGPAAAKLTTPGIYEVLGNGNRVSNPYQQTNASPIKALFAPIGMPSHGSSATYGAVNGGGQKVSAFFVADRSNLAYNGPGGAARHLRIRMLTKPNRWLGGPSSVMNALPWEQMPNDAQDSRDYPNLPLGALGITRTDTGQDAVNGSIPLTQPIYPDTNPDNRIVSPTEMTMTMRVPRFQPANVNRGVKQWKLADGTAFTFGSPYTDISGAVRGNGGGTPDILGPLSVANGQPIGVASGLAYPAGGYVGEVIVEATPNGLATGPGRFNPQAAFNDSSNDGTSEITQAYRALEVGTSVPPSVKMRVVEQTVDIGKLPHGTGYSDLFTANGKIDFRVPFSPSGSRDWPGLSPWDDVSQFGEFFRPFTLVNESNVNLYDVRVGKLMGDAPLTAAGITPLTLSSDQTSASIFAPPYLGPANRQAAGIGVVSSFDHISKASQNFGTAYPERSLWPLPNPYVEAAGITDAANAGLQTTNAPAAGLLGWFNGIQPQPTVHKARVGDTNGTIATLPDTPYDAATVPGFTPLKTKVSLAIPLGTPVGTYSAPIYPFEDNVPLQWQEWLQASKGFGVDSGGNYVDTSHDGVINAVADAATGTRTPIETYSNPTFALKATIREARLTGGVTRGTLSQIDTFAGGLLSANPYDANNNVQPDLLNPPYGFNMLPTAMFQPTGNNNFQVNLYWATQRQPNGSPFLTSGGAKAGFPVADAPWSLGYSALFEGVGGWTFGQSGTNKNANAAWWSVGSGTFDLFPGYNGAGQPNALADLFPSTQAEGAVKGVPFVPGTRMPRSVRYASPAAAVRTFAGAPSNYPTSAQSGYLFWVGSIDKLRGTGAGAASQFTESRTFYAPVPPGNNGQPDATKLLSMTNDPALPKMSPKPLLLNVGGNQDIMYLFWHAGAGTQSQLYVNANQAAGFPAGSWSRDTRLETPDALAWQSDPSPVYHQAWDTVNNKAMDVIDVVYTGVLKNRRTVETMLSRYQIDPATFNLSITSLPEVVQEQMSRTGTTFSYAARDAAWAYGSGPQGQLLPTDKESRIKLYISQNYGPLTPLVPAAKGFTTDAAGDHFPIGRYDPASGLVYYDSILGGQIVIDPRSGTVSFPQVAPGRNDAIYVSYAPMVMRLNTSRDETNIVRTGGYGVFAANDPAFAPRAATVSPGSNQNPIAIMERDFNERGNLVSPRVVFPAGAGAAFPRLWVLYRKSDVSGTVKSTLYYKAMRLMARLPRPFALTNNNGTYSLTNLPTITGNAGPYEVDWVRGRIYFTELDEGRVVTINYTYVGGQSKALTYRIAWGDEISATSLPPDPSAPFVDHTTPEVVLPTDSAVNEGQVTAFQIPASLRTGPAASGQPFQSPQGSELWVFWTSTRAGTTDLFYETVRPNFYPNATGQR